MKVVLFIVLWPVSLGDIAGLGWNEKLTDRDLEGAKILHWSGRSETSILCVMQLNVLFPCLPQGSHG